LANPLNLTIGASKLMKKGKKPQPNSSYRLRVDDLEEDGENYLLTLLDAENESVEAILPNPDDQLNIEKDSVLEIENFEVKTYIWILKMKVAISDGRVTRDTLSQDVLQSMEGNLFPGGSSSSYTGYTPSDQLASFAVDEASRRRKFLPPPIPGSKWAAPNAWKQGYGGFKRQNTDQRNESAVKISRISLEAPVMQKGKDLF
jgi:hypothetical protein